MKKTLRELKGIIISYYLIGAMGLFIVAEICWFSMFILITIRFPFSWLYFSCMLFFIQCLCVWGILTFYKKIKEVNKDEIQNQKSNN
jgi:Ca2+/Na+ antiporter